MKANYIIKKTILTFMVDTLVGKYHQSFQESIDALIQENVDKTSDSAIGFMFNNSCYIHSEIKKENLTAFAILNLRSDPRVKPLHPDLFDKMHELLKLNGDSNIEKARCTSFINYCLSHAETTTEVKLIFNYVGLKKEIEALEEQSQPPLFDAKDNVTELSDYVKAKLDARMGIFQEFLDRIMVMRDLLGL
jgi:hypothetical protein